MRCHAFRCHRSVKYYKPLVLQMSSVCRWIQRPFTLVTPWVCLVVRSTHAGCHRWQDKILPALPRSARAPFITIILVSIITSNEICSIRTMISLRRCRPRRFVRFDPPECLFSCHMACSWWGWATRRLEAGKGPCRWHREMTSGLHCTPNDQGEGRKRV